MKTPESLDDAWQLEDGPIAKFYLIKYAPKHFDRDHLKTLSCEEIKTEIAAWFAEGKA